MSGVENPLLTFGREVYTCGGKAEDKCRSHNRDRIRSALGTALLFQMCRVEFQMHVVMLSLAGNNHHTLARGDSAAVADEYVIDARRQRGRKDAVFDLPQRG